MSESVGLARQVVDNAVCRGEVFDQGAQVTRWAPRGAEPVLYVSSALRLEPGRSIRAGIPVCWPWFGPGRGEGLTPQHGFVRTAAWERASREEAADATTISYRISSESVTSPAWPHSYAAELVARFGRRLELSLTTTNTGEAGWDYEEALHAYLVVGDIHQASIDGLDGVGYFDKVTQRERVHTGALRFAGETDGVFRTDRPVTLIDPVLGRRITVTTAGATNVVVWNPWSDKAATVGDIGNDDWRGFVCIEGANAFANAVWLDPGASHTTSYTLQVEPL